jgi:hypothetical protein
MLPDPCSYFALQTHGGTPRCNQRGLDPHTQVTNVCSRVQLQSRGIHFPHCIIPDHVYVKNEVSKTFSVPDSVVCKHLSSCACVCVWVRLRVCVVWVRVFVCPHLKLCLELPGTDRTINNGHLSMLLERRLIYLCLCLWFVPLIPPLWWLARGRCHLQIHNQSTNSVARHSSDWKQLYPISRAYVWYRF